MNYLLQLVAFRKRKMIKQLPANTILLYHTLLEYSNEIGFPDSFTAANSALQAKSSLSQQKIHQARSLLQKDGYITYIMGSGKQCGTYSLIDLTVNYDTHFDKQSDSHCETKSDTYYEKQSDTEPHSSPNSDTNSGTQKVHKVSTLTKQDLNETKQNKHKHKHVR